MEFLSKPRTWLVVGVTLLGLFLIYQFWHWVVERDEVEPDHYLVRVQLWGKNLPPGEIIAPDDTYKGIQAEVLPEGRYFHNPFLWRVEKHEVIRVDSGQCLVLTRKYGKQIPHERLVEGDFLAREGERGIIEKPLPPGKHRLNPYAYDWKIYPAVEIGPQQRGVRTLKVGLDPRGLPDQADGTPYYVVPDGYRGVQENPAQPGTHYINPHVEEIVPVDIGIVTVMFDDIEFPSRDGFTLNPHVKVRYRVDPQKAPVLLVTLTDEGRLNQRIETPEEAADNQILQKVIVPLVRGYVRIEGSKFAGRDFISKEDDEGMMEKSNAREQLQAALLAKIPEKCKEVGVIIEEISLQKIEGEEELNALANLISERVQAVVKREQNESVIQQYEANIEEEKNKALKPRETAKGEIDRTFKQESIAAMKRLEVEEKKLEQDLQNAQTDFEAAEKQAAAILETAKAEADVIDLQNEAEVAGLKTAILGFPNVDTFAQYHMMQRLSPSLSEIFASDDSDFSRLFARYMSESKQTVPREEVNAP